MPLSDGLRCSVAALIEIADDSLGKLEDRSRRGALGLVVGDHVDIPASAHPIHAQGGQRRAGRGVFIDELVERLVALNGLLVVQTGTQHPADHQRFAGLACKRPLFLERRHARVHAQAMTGAAGLEGGAVVRAEQLAVAQLHRVQRSARQGAEEPGQLECESSGVARSLRPLRGKLKDERTGLAAQALVERSHHLIRGKHGIEIPIVATGRPSGGVALKRCGALSRGLHEEAEVVRHDRRVLGEGLAGIGA